MSDINKYMPSSKKAIKVKTNITKTRASEEQAGQAKTKTKNKKTPKKDKDIKAITPVVDLASQDVNLETAVQNEPEEKPAVKIRSLGLYRKIAISFIVLTVVLLIVIFYFSFIKVVITLIPSQERLSSELIIDIYDKEAKAAAAKSAITGIVKQIEIEQTKTKQASGSEILGEEVTGKVMLINNYNKNQPLVATTRLLSPDNKLFRIKNTVNVPANGQIEVEVYADEPSQDMAIGPTSFTIPGPWAGLQDKIYAENKEAMKFAQKVKKYIKQSDIDEAVTELKDSLLAKAKSEIGQTYKDYDQVIYDIDNNSITQQVGGKVGEEKEEFSLTMKTKVTVVAFKDDKVLELARAKLASTLPDDKELIEFTKDNISYSVNKHNLEQNKASVKTSFAGKMIIKEDASIIEKDKLLGLTKEQLADYLSSFSEIAGFDIKFSPAFIKKVPNLEKRIRIEVEK